MMAKNGVSPKQLLSILMHGTDRAEHHIQPGSHNQGSELLVTGRSAGFDAEEGGTNVTGAIDEVLNGDDDALLLEGIETSFAAGTNIEADIG
ncbi:hypothetical protein GCK72_002105 [Caenorhabditis remanei]|uniref:Uncharacterized protein n=1 Tax=Caenorhabditis remanei TaxID=31234 RepID=A0A6A5HVJ6_CAERE|nr:hypothetical protein GCK72_002105 [Caenorhabditis remanei]KAF1770287.1 hypothetical protein GCK72_002105 [Caenorhabditis remanei]